MRTDPRRTVQVSHRFSASAEPVFDAWLDPQKAGKFLFAIPKGQMVRVEIDGRVGGKFCFVDRRDNEDIEHIGEYLEVVRRGWSSRLSYRSFPRSQPSNHRHQSAGHRLRTDANAGRCAS